MTTENRSGSGPRWRPTAPGQPLFSRIPRPSAVVVARHRLFRALAESTRQPLTLLRGPTGAGKTTLLVDWLSRDGAEDGPGATVRWLDMARIPAGDTGGERDGFWSAVVTTLNDGVAPPALPPSADAARLHETLRGAVHVAAGGGPVLLIVDGWSTRDRSLDLEVLAAVEAVPELRWLVCHRSSGAMERQRIFCGFDSTLIGPCELALTPAEVAELVAGVETRIGAEEVHRLAFGSPRFARALLLRAQELGPGASAAAIVDAVVHDLRDAFSNAAQDSELVDRLFSAAVPESIPESVAAAAGPDDPLGLAAAEVRGYGSWIDTSSGRWFYFVPIVRRALRDELAAVDPARSKRLAREWAGRLGRAHPHEALRLAVAAEDLDVVTAVLRDNALELMIDLGAEAVLELLAPVPTARLYRRPVIAMALALAYNAVRPHRVRGRELFGLAVASTRLPGRSVSASDRFLLEAMESTGLRIAGELEQAAAVAGKALARYRELPVAERDLIGRYESTLLLQLALVLSMAGQMDSAVAACSLGITAASRAGNQRAEGYALSMMAAFYAAEGDMGHAEDKIQRSRATGWLELLEHGRLARGPEPFAPAHTAVAGHEHVLAYAASPLRLAEATAAFERLDLEAARSALQPLLHDAETNEFWSQIMSYEVLLEVLSGRAAHALAKLEATTARQRDLPALNPAGAWALDSSRIWINLAVGNVREARRLLAPYLGHIPAAAGLEAIVWLAQSRPAEAARAARTLGDNPLPRDRFHGALCMLAAALQSGTESTGLLDDVVSMVELHGMRLSIGLLPAPDFRRVVAAAAAQGVDLGIPQDFEPVIPGGQEPVVLSGRERAVITELASTGNVSEIAVSLFVSVNTVKSQLRSAYRKLGASNRDDAIAAARRAGLL